MSDTPKTEALILELDQHVRDYRDGGTTFTVADTISLLSRVRNVLAAPADAEAGRREALTYRVRDEKLLRDTISMLCDVLWNGGKTKPGQHVWSIPVDKDRDFDCILSDAIDELVALRALAGAPHGDGQAGTSAEEK